MSRTRERMENMLFDYQTTTLTDYRDGEIVPQVKPVYKEKPPPEKRIFSPPKYIHSLVSWRDYMPFDSFIKPNDITRHNPHRAQKEFKPPPDTKLAEVIKTRPRLVMTPAVSLDDIEEPARSVIINDTYVTEMTKKNEEALSPYFSVKAPYAEHPAPARPIFLPVWKQPYVSPEWRWDSVTWDRRQQRAYCDPTKEFWMKPEHQPTSCRACEETAMVKAHRRTMRQMQAKIRRH